MAEDLAPSNREDALAAIDDIKIRRFHMTVRNLGRGTETTNFVYVVQNKSSYQSHITVPMVPTRRSVRVNMKVRSHAKEDLVYFPSSFSYDVAADRGRKLALSIRTRLKQGGTAFPQYCEGKVGFSLAIDDLFSTEDIQSVFSYNPKAGANQESVDRLTGMCFLVIFFGRSISDVGLERLANDFQYWVMLHAQNYIPFCQLTTRLGTSEEADQPSWTLLRHEDRSGIIVASPLRFRLLSGLTALATGRRVFIVPVILPHVETVHYRVKVAPELQIKSVTRMRVKGNEQIEASAADLFDDAEEEVQSESQDQFYRYFSARTLEGWRKIEYELFESGEAAEAGFLKYKIVASEHPMFLLAWAAMLFLAVLVNLSWTAPLILIPSLTVLTTLLVTVAISSLDKPATNRLIVPRAAFLALLASAPIKPVFDWLLSALRGL